MSRRRKTNFEDSLRYNSRTYGIYFERLTELAMSMFKWENLPETVDSRFMELTLFYDGMAVFFRDEVLGDLCLQCIINGRLNVYRIPINRRAFAVNGYQRDLDINNSVIIWNNYLHTNSLMPILHFAQRLWDIDRTADVNVRAQKTPVLITGAQNKRLTLVNLYKEFDGNSPVIYAEDSLNTDSIKVLKTDAPFVAQQLQILKDEIWHEALTYLGIVAVSTNKKERMIPSEVAAVQGDTFASRNSRLKARREAAEEINRMFGLDIRVNYDDDYIRENLALYRETNDGITFETGNENE